MQGLWRKEESHDNDRNNSVCDPIQCCDYLQNIPIGLEYQHNTFCLASQPGKVILPQVTTIAVLMLLSFRRQTVALLAGPVLLTRKCTFV